MKHQWDEKDIVCGRVVCKPPQAGWQSDGEPFPFEPNGWTAKWTFKIGYGADDYVETVPEVNYQKGKAIATGRSKTYFVHKYRLVALTDGMIGDAKTASEMIDYLNEENMMPMPHNWLMKTMEFLKDCYHRKD